MLKPKLQNVQVFSPSRKNDGNKRRKFSSFPFSNFEKREHSAAFSDFSTILSDIFQILSDVFEIPREEK